jgi:plastocyanin
MRKIYSMFAVAMALGLSFPAWAAPTAEEAKAICAEAEARYKEISGEKALPPNTSIVKMYKYTFCPAELTVKAGTTVRWINLEKRTSHDVWFKEAGQEPGDRLFAEEIWEMPFTTPGTYPYLCSPHWQQEGMKGLLKVE